MNTAEAIAKIAQSLDVDEDDLTIEIRAGGRTTIVAYADGQRITLANLQSFEELRPYVEGLTTPHKPRINVVQQNATTT